MDQYIVSARKYRPATFETVIGQAAITTTLKNAIRNKHLAQSYLFCGPRGVGKTTCARILAKTINCSNISEGIEACNVCESCISFNNNQSLNIYELDAASNNSVDDMRGLVEQVRYAPHQGKYKIYIIDEVHMLTTQAFNAFLKTLEEPPPYAIFILATTEKHKIIPTILSRCQIFDFSRIGVEDIAKHLAYVAEMEHVSAEEAGLHIIAQKADGALRDALSIFDQIVSFSNGNITYETVITNLNVLDYDYYFKVTDCLLNGDIPGCLQIFNEILSHGFDGNHFVTGMASHLRDVLVSRDNATLKLLEVSAGIREKYKIQAASCPTTFLIPALQILNQCDYQYKTVKNQRLHVELALIRIASLSPPGKSTMPVEKPMTVASKPKSVTEPVGTIIKKVAEPVETPMSKPVETSENSGTISLSAALGKKTKDTNSSSGSEKVPQKELTNPFTENDLLMVWKKFVEITSEQKKIQLFTALTGRDPVLCEGNVINIYIDNKAQEDELRNNSKILLDFLMKELMNSTVSLNVQIAEKSAVNKTPYTASERYERLKQINPAIDDLKKQLDLEIE